MLMMANTPPLPGLHCSQDDVPDEWLPEASVAQDLLDDWAAGLERAPVAALLDVQQWGTSREYLVQWADGSPVSGQQLRNGGGGAASMRGS